MTVECSFVTTSPKLEHAVTVVQVIGEQRLCSLFCFDVHVVGHDAEFGLQAYAAARARIRLTDGETARCIDRIVTRVRCLSGTTDSIPTVFTVQPELMVPTQRHGHRIFQEQTIREIVDQVPSKSTSRTPIVNEYREPVRGATGGSKAPARASQGTAPRSGPRRLKLGWRAVRPLPGGRVRWHWCPVGSCVTSSAWTFPHTARHGSTPPS